MDRPLDTTGTEPFMKSLGFPAVRVHHGQSHFDFSKPTRRILVIGPMGSGKTEFASRVWRDSVVIRSKSGSIAGLTTTGTADRRQVFFIRSILDAQRFGEYPDDALAYRGGYERCGDRIARIRDSFELEEILADNPGIGTWIVDEGSFYDERLAYVVRNESERRGLVFIFPTLILNFRREIFNPTARLLLETATDVFPLTAYCEHDDCITDSFYTYRYYKIDERECPALYFDPLIVIGGDRKKDDPMEPNYCTRCDRHHYLPGKEYTFLILKPLGEAAAAGKPDELLDELTALHSSPQESRLYFHMSERFGREEDGETGMNALRIPCIAEKALMYLFAEQNLIPEELLVRCVNELKLNKAYIRKTLSENRRTVNLDQISLPF